MTRAKLIHRIAMGTMLIIAGPSTCGCFSMDFSDSILHSTYKPRPQPSIPWVYARTVVRAVQEHRVSIEVTATDAVSLEADLSALPAGNDASFVGSHGPSEMKLLWTPTVNDIGPYDVTFIATNATGTRRVTTTIYVTDHLDDAAPLVTAPAEVFGKTGMTFSFDVRAEDPDGDPILGWRYLVQGCDAAGTVDLVNPDSYDVATFICTFDRPDTLDVVAYAYNFQPGRDTTRVMVSAPE